MRHRTTTQFLIFSLLGVLFASPLYGQGATAQGRGATMVATVRVVVPAIIRVVVDSTELDPNGLPVVRVRTNVPALRAQARPAPELRTQPDFALVARGQTRGGANSGPGVEVVEPMVVRYTSALP
jgi:hypothetical protein